MQLVIFKKDFIEYKTLIYWNKIDLVKKTFYGFKRRNY